MSMQEIVAIRLLTFKGLKNKLKAFQWMGKKLAKPWEATGLVFSKHMGVGAGNGFSILPDFSMYAFIGLFESEVTKEEFFSKDLEWKEFESLSCQLQGVDGSVIKVHGQWNGKNPFNIFPLADKSNKMAVITRASIDWKKAWLFWMNVPKSSRNIQANEELLLAKGVGELPLVEQATVSIWNSQESLEKFAYRSANHQPMIKKTRKYNWYKEEMFVRMEVLKTYGI